MRTEEITIYTYDELTDKAKEKAREWYRSGSLDYDWWDSVYDDFLNICRIMGVDTSERDIQFSGFWSQGDGASFTGSYAYAKGSAKAIREHAPQDKELHGIVDELAALQRRYFYGIDASITRMGSRYVHSHTMQVEAHTTHHDRHLNDDDEQHLKELMRDLADWLYCQLEKEYEYLTSDEAVEESIRANEYEFTEDGAIN